MIKWMIRFYILISILYSKINYINCQIEYDFNDPDIEYYYHHIEPGKSQIKYLEHSDNIIDFKDINDTNDLIVNFYPIEYDIVIANSSNIDLDEKVKDNIHSIFIGKNDIKNTKLTVDPSYILIENDKNFYFRFFPIVINSLYMNEFKINIEDKEYMSLYFNEKIPYIILFYKLNNLNEDYFISLSFSFDEDCSFIIDIKNCCNETISSSSYIFLDYYKLLKIENGILTIKITYNKKISSEQVLIFKLYEPNSISILRKDILNQGFTISKEENQYYYLEVFSGEEGEIMLHNKRLDGKLYGIIKPKSDIDPYNKEEYIKEDKNTILKFNVNTLKLNFKSYQTEQCENGCYLFIIYSHDKYDNISNVAFEYTLLARIWNEDGMSSQLINIPFNEYLFGTFDEEDLYIHHYYYLKIPLNTEEIVIQFEGDNIEGFIGNGQRKLYTFRDINNTINLKLKENKMIIKYNQSTLIGSNEPDIKNYISLAFRPKNYFRKMLSFYYFRILALREGENNIIYPLDSNVGNLCSPQKEGNEYYCYCLLKNNLNEFNLNYSISTSHQIDIHNYNYFEFINGVIKRKNLNKYALQVKYDNNFSLIKFRFLNDKIVNILSTLSNQKEIIYPQIYSVQMYHLREEYIKYVFELKDDMSIIFKYIQGNGTITYNTNSTFNPNSNYKGKSLLFYYAQSNNLSFQGKEFIFNARIEKIKKIKTITQGETFEDTVKLNSLPIYYYIKNDEDQITNMIINFRIKLSKCLKNLTKPFIIDGYIMNETEFNNFMEIRFCEDYKNLGEPIKGSYNKFLESGLLNINNTIKKGDFIVIKIYNSYTYTDNDVDILIDILALLKREGNYILPVNNYINDIYDNTENKTYKVIIYEENKNNTDIMVEFIPDCSIITISNYIGKDNYMIQMENITDNYGIVQKFKITDFNDDFILKVEVPKEISYAHYIIRYNFINK